MLIGIVEEKAQVQLIISPDDAFFGPSAGILTCYEEEPSSSDSVTVAQHARC